MRELKADVVELLETGLDSVRIVAAGPASFATGDQWRERPLVIASEYERLTRNWIKQQSLHANFVRSYGATEVFPPEDADIIVDNTATGTTLRESGLVILDEIMRSSTCLFANPRVLDDPARRDVIDSLVLVLRSVLDARTRVMLEVNVSRECLEAMIARLPCMREPTVSASHGDSGYAVKAAVIRADLPQVIPAIKAGDGTDIVVSSLDHLVP